MANNFDITPSPRVLRMLGEIDFKPWQCFAELIDNSIDAFKNASLEKHKILKPVVDIHLPILHKPLVLLRSGVLDRSGRIILKDNGPGMSEKQLNECVKAGYSGNDPIDKLGLFGMGFNIATARLGTKTEVWTARIDEQNWYGTSIDFDQLERGGKFSVPVFKKAKLNPDEHGTEIIITKLKKERTEILMDSRTQNQLRNQLGKIYGRFMLDQNLTIRIDDVEVRPWQHCVWGEDRTVKYQNEDVPAVIKIDRKLESKKFCKRCWLWLQTGESVCENCGKNDAIVDRERRVKGWIGIQRHFHPDEYGIDFIRNGRKILIGDKSVFMWLNPDTMQDELEYPIDMVGRDGGRIIGEIEIDHVRVSHQKDAFQTSDPEWRQTINIIRGESPLRPNIAEKYKLPPNESPLAKLFKAYRRGDIGIRCLVPGDGFTGQNINSDLKEWAKRFHAGDLEYQSDQKWYDAVLIGEKAVKETKRPERSKAEAPEIIRDLFSEGKGTETQKSKHDIFKEHATKEPLMSKEYSISDLGIPPIKVDVFRVNGAHKICSKDAEPLPALFLPELSGASAFYYDSNDEFFTKFQYTPHEIFMLELANHIYVLLGDADRRMKWPITKIFGKLIKDYYPDELIDYATLSARAKEFFTRFAEIASELIKHDAERAFLILDDHEMEALIRNVAKDLHQGIERIDELKKSGKFVEYAPFSFIPKLVRELPANFFDNNYWSVPYATISLGTEAATNKIKKEQVDRIYNMLMDALWLAEARAAPTSTTAQKESFLRAKHSLNLLEIERAKDD